LAMEAGLREGEQGFEFKIDFYVHKKLVSWGITTLDTNSKGHTIILDAVSGEVIEYVIP